ncbi:DoxX family protein [Flindersiella endophytica]
MYVTTERAAASVPGFGSRLANVGLWVLQVLTALFFLMVGIGKLTGSPEIAATFDQLGFGDWFRYLIGVLEIAGAVALFVPRLVGLAALALVALMIGAAVTQQLVTGGGVVLPLALLLPSAIIAWGRRRSLGRLLAVLRR